MPTKQEILKELVGESGPISAVELAAKLKVKPSQISSQIDRCVKDGEIEKTEAGLVLTETGQAEQEPAPTQADVSATEYDHFKAKGRTIGIPEPLLHTTTEHFFSGGDITDLDWLKQALIEMDIRQDMRQRLYHSWRTHLHLPIPPGGEEGLKTGEEKASETKVTTEAKGVRTHIIVDDLPVFVGEGNGDMGLEDAKHILTMRALNARFTQKGSGGGGEGVGTVEGILRIIEMLDKRQGGGEGKSYVVTQTPEGTAVSEIDPRTPLVLPAQGGGGGEEAPKGWLLDAQGNLREVKANEPVVIERQAPAQQSQVYVVDRASGQVHKQQSSGEPIVIQMAAPAQAHAAYQPIQLTDAEGKPITMDLNSLIAWKKFEADERRADQRQNMLIDGFNVAKEELPTMFEAMKKTAEAYNQEASVDRGSVAEEPPPTPAGKMTGRRGRQAAPAQPQGLSGMCPGCEKQIFIPEGDPLVCPICQAQLHAQSEEPSDE